jgi:hypothetical protein
VGKLEAGGRTCRINVLLRPAAAMAARPEELLDGIVWVPAPETQGSFSFNSRPLSHQFRRSESLGADPTQAKKSKAKLKRRTSSIRASRRST